MIARGLVWLGLAIGANVADAIFVASQYEEWRLITLAFGLGFMAGTLVTLVVILFFRHRKQGVDSDSR